MLLFISFILKLTLIKKISESLLLCGSFNLIYLYICMYKITSNFTVLYLFFVIKRTFFMW